MRGILAVMLVMVGSACAEQSPVEMMREHEQTGSHPDAVSRGEAAAGIGLLITVLGFMGRAMKGDVMDRFAEGAKRMTELHDSVIGVNSRLDRLNGQVGENTEHRKTTGKSFVEAQVDLRAAVNELRDMTAKRRIDSAA